MWASSARHLSRTSKAYFHSANFASSKLMYCPNHRVAHAADFGLTRHEYDQDIQWDKPGKELLFLGD